MSRCCWWCRSSINVFLTFSLSLLGLSRHWWQVTGRRYAHWKSRLAALAARIHAVAAAFWCYGGRKFTEGGWLDAD